MWRIVLSAVVAVLASIVINVVSNYLSVFADKYKKFFVILLFLLVGISIYLTLPNSNIPIYIYNRRNTSLIVTGIMIVSSIIGVICIYHLLYSRRRYRQQLLQYTRYSSRKYRLKIQELRQEFHRNIRLPLAIVLIVPLVVYSGIQYLQYFQQVEQSIFKVLVADFDGPDPENYRITETVLSRLQSELRSYPNIIVESLKQSISQQDGSSVAKQWGSTYGANLVIWGWYGLTEEKVPLNLNIEILCPLKCDPSFDGSNESTYTTLDLNRLTLQNQLANQVSNIVRFVFALERMSANDWERAVNSFSDLIDKDSPFINNANVYQLRAYAYVQLNEFELAESDFNQSIALNQTDAEYYHVRGLFQMDSLNKPLAAIEDFSQAITIESDSAVNYRDRGIAYFKLKNYINASIDLHKAIAFYEQQDTLTGDDTEHLARAHVYLGTIFDINRDYENAVEHLTAAINLKPNYANAFLLRGGVYLNQRSYTKASNDLNEALRLGLDLDREFTARSLLGAIQAGKADSIEVNDYGADPGWGW